MTQGADAAGKSAQRYRFQYAAKFLCTANIPGTSLSTPSVLPGQYRTVVNIHNPNNREVRFRKKIAVGRETSRFIDDQVGPDQTIDVNCDQITRDFGITFIHGAEGFLVVESTHSLDVTAIYTAGKFRADGEVESIDVSQIREREIE
jgi:hypothetical protein